MESLSAIVGIDVPTGSPEDYTGQDGTGVQFGFATDGHVGEGLQFNGHLGYAIRPETHLAELQLGDEILTSLGLSFQASEGAPIIQSEAKFWFPAADLGKSEATSGDLNVGLTWPLVRGHEATIGAGFGVLPGVGSPGWRGFFGYTYRPSIPALGATGSGQSADTPTDVGVQPITRMGDQDGDGLMDHQDTCPTLPEDRDNFLDQDGCPDPDNDLDGVQDVQDAAANAPEDWDGFEDTDGVLDADNDRDGIADSEDRCPNQAGAGDGCPGTPMDWVEQIDRLGGISKPIHIGQFIYPPNPISFIKGTARLSKDGESQMALLSTFIQMRPQILRIEISTHVHTSEGSKYDQWLSAQRALAVQAALVNAGIDRARLFPRAYGRSLVRAVPKFARKSNTTIEFRVLETNEAAPVFENVRRPNGVTAVDEMDVSNGQVNVIRPRVVRLIATITPQSPLSFKGRTAQLTSDDEKELDALAMQVSAHSAVRVEIGVHTSGLGNAKRQLELSQDRAEALRTALIEKGVSGDILTAKGYGGSAPIESPRTFEGRQKNRRVELRVMGFKKSDDNESVEDTQ